MGPAWEGLGRGGLGPQGVQSRCPGAGVGSRESLLCADQARLLSGGFLSPHWEAPSGLCPKVRRPTSSLTPGLGFSLRLASMERDLGGRVVSVAPLLALF